MDLVREDRIGDDRYVWFASSLGGSAVSTAAGLAALEVLRAPGTYEKLFQAGAQVRAGLAAALAEHGIEATVQGDGPLAAVVFTKGR